MSGTTLIAVAALAVSAVNAVVSYRHTEHRFRLSTYPVPDITLTVTAPSGAGSPTFTAKIRHVGEKTTILAPRLYVFVSDPGKSGEQGRRRGWQRVHWFCFYKRTLADIPPGQAEIETFPVQGVMDSRVDKFIYYLVEHFPQFFTIAPIVGQNRESLAGYNFFEVGSMSPGFRPVPLLIRLEYQLGLEGQPRLEVEQEYNLQTVISMPGMGTGSQRTQYQLGPGEPIRWPRMARRHLRAFHEHENISIEPSV